MNEIGGVALALGAGVMLGGMFFGGLWWTIQKVVSSDHPALWTLGSLLLRTGVALAGFYYIARDHWVRLPACLLGFVMARLIATRLTRAAANTNDSARETGHAS